MAVVQIAVKLAMYRQGLAPHVKVCLFTAATDASHTDAALNYVLMPTAQC